MCTKVLSIPFFLFFCTVELNRLLSTAKDEDRISMIKKAINALDVTESDSDDGEPKNDKNSNSKDKFFHTLHPSIHSSIFESETVNITND